MEAEDWSSRRQHLRSRLGSASSEDLVGSVYKRLAVEGKDFVQDTQDGVGDEFEFIPDSDEEDGLQLTNLHGSDEEIVPEIEVQEISDEELIGQRTVLGNCRQVLLGEDSEASTPIIPEKENNEQASRTRNKSIVEVSIADAEIDDEGINPFNDEHGMDVRGQSQAEDDHDLKVLVTNMLCTLIPAYSKVVKRPDP